MNILKKNRISNFILLNLRLSLKVNFIFEIPK